MALASLAAAGCGTLTSYQSAEPVEPGRWRVAAALTGGGFADREQASRLPFAQAELEVRRGVAEDTDVGLKLYTVGAEVSGRHRLRAGRWQWAMAGAVGGIRNRDRALVTDGLLLHARATTIATRRTSARWAFSAAPTLTLSRYWFDGGGAASGLLLGATANAERRLGARWRLVPELGVHATVAGEVPLVGFVGHLGVGVAVDL
ncbi:MAG: hypothetical protein R2939_02960 [Kofleriaceae bacterium]